MDNKSLQRSAKIVYLSTAIVWTGFLTFPLYFMLIGSLKGKGENSGMWQLPETLHWSNYADAYYLDGSNTTILQLIINSSIVTVGTIILVGITSSMAAYSLSRFQWGLRSVVISFFTMAIAIPGHSLLIPLFRMITQMGLKDSHWALILINTAGSLPFSIIMLRSYFTAFPKEIEEAAKIDGCSEIRLFFKMFLPLNLGAITTICTIAGINAWNELMFSMTLIDTPGKRTLPAALAQFTGDAQTMPSENILFAILTIAMVPIILIFILLQRFVMKGSVSGAVKG